VTKLGLCFSKRGGGGGLAITGPSKTYPNWVKALKNLSLSIGNSVNACGDSNQFLFATVQESTLF
jgi:hypothetical protein